MRQVVENLIAVSIALTAIFSLTNWEYASNNPYFSQETYIIWMVCFCIIISFYILANAPTDIKYNTNGTKNLVQYPMSGK